MPNIWRSVNYYGNEADLQNIANLFRNIAWPAWVNEVYITNGWHTGWEPRNGVLTEVTYCDYCVNADGSMKYHYYWN